MFKRNVHLASSCEYHLQQQCTIVLLLMSNESITSGEIFIVEMEPTTIKLDRLQSLVKYGLRLLIVKEELDHIG